ncbi:hypothetical protein VTL71DRAFT_15450 [Oculimacula yallundae]|uniref:2EXR domain-containing protein n=1 Tax=Oculimacula yallundae TaxID=86028 RepID=A0ABR4CGL6_9HELO
MAGTLDSKDTVKAIEDSNDGSTFSDSSNGSQNLSNDLPSPSTDVSFTLFPKLPPELRLRILKLHLPGNSLKYVGMQQYRYMFAWDSNTERWVINVPFPSLLHVNRESRYECLKYYAIMWPQRRYHSCAYYPMEKTALVFRCNLDSSGWRPFSKWLNHLPSELLRSIKHLVFEEKRNLGEAYLGLHEYDRLPGRQGFSGVDWKRLEGLESFGVCHRNSEDMGTMNFEEDEDTDWHRQRQAELIADLSPDPDSTTWNPETRIRFGRLEIEQ